MLEARAHQHARLVLEDVDGAVAVVHVEVHHRDALDAARQRLVHAHRDVVRKQKPIAIACSAWCPGRRTAQNAFASASRRAPPSRPRPRRARRGIRV
jgi:hypothetical protein